MVIFFSFFTYVYLLDYRRISNHHSNKFVKRAVAAGTIKLPTGSSLISFQINFTNTAPTVIPINATMATLIGFIVPS